MGLDMFHALGKVLYNKRHVPGTAPGAVDADADDDAAAADAAQGQGGKAGGSGGASSVAAEQLQAHALCAGQRWMMQRASAALKAR